MRSFDRSAQTGDEATVGMKIGTTEMAAAPAPKTAVASPVPAPAPAVVSPPPPPVAVAPPAPARPAPAAPPAAPDARVSMDDLRGLLPAKP
ncbi:hypothetical protein D9M69_567690 [compost metagenome]